MGYNVLFSDEINVEVGSRKNRVMLRRTPHEKMHPDCSMHRTKQGSGSIGIWACMNFEGVGCFKLFDGRLDSQRHLDILDNYLMSSIDIFRKDMGIIFQQDNAPCHTAKICKQWFEENNIKIMSWPANRPDLNCIENLWSWLDHNLVKLKQKIWTS